MSAKPSGEYCVTVIVNLSTNPNDNMSIISPKMSDGFSIKRVGVRQRVLHLSLLAWSSSEAIDSE